MKYYKFLKTPVTHRKWQKKVLNILMHIVPTIVMSKIQKLILFKDIKHLDNLGASQITYDNCYGNIMTNMSSI